MEKYAPTVLTKSINTSPGCLAKNVELLYTKKAKRASWYRGTHDSQHQNEYVVMTHNESRNYHFRFYKFSFSRAKREYGGSRIFLCEYSQAFLSPTYRNQQGADFFIVFFFEHYLLRAICNKNMFSAQSF